MDVNAIAAIVAQVLASQNAVAAPVNTVAPTKQRPPIKVVAQEDTGLLVRPYEGNDEYGYIQVEESEINVRSLSWIGNKRRTALLKGTVKDLKVFLREKSRNNILPGVIVVQEYLEQEVPDKLAREFFGDLTVRDYDEAVNPFLKRSGKEGIELTKGGQRICRFSFYDPEGEYEDITIEHDNQREVGAHNQQLRAERAAAKKAELDAENARVAEEAKVAKQVVAPAAVVAPVVETVDALLPGDDSVKEDKKTGK